MRDHDTKWVFGLEGEIYDIDNGNGTTKKIAIGNCKLGGRPVYDEL